jgi:hypothetical protein
MIIPKLCLLAFIVSSVIGQDTAYLNVITGDSIQRFKMVKSEGNIYSYDGTIDSGHKLYQSGLEFIKTGTKFNIKQTYANDTLSLEVEINIVTIEKWEMENGTAKPITDRYHFDTTTHVKYDEPFTFGGQTRVNDPDSLSLFILKIQND